MNIYASNKARECTLFNDIFGFATDNMMLFGDFNSVVHSSDCLSGNTDATLTLLNDLLLTHGLEEIDGPHRNIFTYHHPSLSVRKSRLDHIYVSFSHMGL